MGGGEDFFYTHDVLYLLSTESAKADRAEELIAARARTSASRKRACRWTSASAQRSDGRGPGEKENI
jgi:hypothetical protein